VLRQEGEEVKPGPAFRGQQLFAAQTSVDNEDQQSPQFGDTILPKGISYRLKNLYLLNLDMHGELDGWLNSASVGDEA
jgi:hypothetical protein